MIATLSSPPVDVPFTVRDRRRKGYFTIDNELLDRYGAQLGPYGLVVYMALARFANQDSACWPSLATIAHRTGMSRRQVIREIDKLQTAALVTVEAQLDARTGEHKTNRYILLDTASGDSQSLGSDTQTLPRSDSQTLGGDSSAPKQDTKNQTQHRNNPQRTNRARCDQENTNTSDEHQTTVVGAIGVIASFAGGSTTLEKSTRNQISVTNVPPPHSGDSPSPTLERHQTGVSALLVAGMTPKVAQRLAERYSLARIEEKLDYLDFLQQYQPDKVKTPCGWLKTAIEDDYAAPDGYLSPAAAEQWITDQAQLEEEEQAQAHAAAAARQQAQAHAAARAQAYRAWLTQTYGTTPADVAFWQQAVAELDFTFSAHREIFQRYVQPAEMLTVTDVAVRLGFPATDGVAHLSHPGTKTRIERTLSALAGRPVQVCYEIIPEPALLLLEEASATGESPGPAL